MFRLLSSFCAAMIAFSGISVLAEAENKPVVQLDFTEEHCAASPQFNTRRVEFIDKGQQDAGARFNGRDSIMTLIQNERLNNLDLFTVEVWFKLLGNPPEGVNFMTLLSKNLTGDGRRDTFNLAVWCADPDGTRQTAQRNLWARVGTGEATIQLRGGGRNIEEGKLHHAALVCDDSTAYIYLDGVMVGRQSLPPGWRPYKSTYPVAVGVWPAYRNYFNGIISHLTIHDIALSPDKIKDNYISGIAAQTSGAQNPLFTVPIADIVPDIHAGFSEENWKRAIVIDGFLNHQSLLSIRPAKLYMVGCRERIYLAIITSTWDGALKSDAIANGPAVALDDSIEFRVAAENSQYFLYRIAVNAAGKFYESRHDHQTSGETKTQFSSLTADGKWVCQMSIPLNKLGYDGDRTIRFNVGRNYIKPPIDAFDVGTPEKYTDTLAGTIDSFANYAEMRIGSGSTPVATLNIGGAPEIGEIIAKIQIDGNVDGETLEGELEVVSDGVMVARKRESGKQHAVGCRIDKKLETPADPVIVTIGARAQTADGQVLLSRVVPFWFSNNIFDLDYLVDRDAGLLILDLDKQMIGAFTPERNILVRLVDESGKKIFEKLVENYNRGGKFTQITVPLDILPDMTPLEIKAALVDEQNRNIFMRETSFMKTENSPGINCHIGDDNTVPVPWTPLVYRADFNIGCWNRNYNFNHQLILAQTEDDAGAILESPVILKVKQDGKTLDWGKVSQRFLEQNDDAGTILSEASSGNVRLRCKITVEFDGMVRVDGVLSTNKPKQLDSITLKVPVKTSIAKYLFASQGNAPGQNYFDNWRNRIGTLGQSWQSRFTPFVWLGDEDRGLCWFAENDKGWINANDNTQIEIVRNNGKTVLRINYADKPFELAEPFEFTFGLQATPVKPRPADWRKIRYGIFRNPQNSSSIIVGWGGGSARRSSWIHWPLQCDPNSLSSEVRLAKGLGFEHVTVYSLPQASDTGVPEVRYFLEEWASDKSDGRPRKYPTMMNYQREFACAFLGYGSKSYHNFWIYNFHNLLKATPGLGGVYYDGAIVFSTNNPRQNALYVRNGEERGSYPIFAARDFYKRVYKMVKALNPDNMVTAHISCTRAIPHESFFDVLVDAEHLGSPLTANNYDYIDVLPLDVWRTQYTCRQTGGIPVFLPQIRRAFDKSAKKVEDNKAAYAKATRTMLAMLLIHDISIMMDFADEQEVGDYVKALDKFGIANSEFYPYWSSKELVSGFSDNIKISMYKNQEGSILLGIANIGNGSLNGDIKINLTGLGMKKASQATNLVTGEKINFDGSRLRSISIAGKDYKMVVIQ